MISLKTNTASPITAVIGSLQCARHFLGTSPVFSSLNPNNASTKWRDYYSSHFTDEETELQKYLIYMAKVTKLVSSRAIIPRQTLTPDLVVLQTHLNSLLSIDVFKIRFNFSTWSSSLFQVFCLHLLPPISLCRFPFSI